VYMPCLLTSKLQYWKRRNLSSFIASIFWSWFNPARGVFSWTAHPFQS